MSEEDYQDARNGSLWRKRAEQASDDFMDCAASKARLNLEHAALEREHARLQKHYDEVKLDLAAAEAVHSVARAQWEAEREELVGMLTEMKSLGEETVTIARAAVARGDRYKAERDRLLRLLEEYGSE